MKHILITLLAILGYTAPHAFAQEGLLPFTVTLGGKAAAHTKGEAFAKIADAVAADTAIEIGAMAAHVTALSGMELFEAVVSLDDISAVVFRSAK